jgi:DNA invertase Pin-like site-specific DNA recombinase
MKELIGKLINKHGGIRKVAKFYGISHQTLKNWSDNEGSIKRALEFYQQAMKDLKRK